MYLKVRKTFWAKSVVCAAQMDWQLCFTGQRNTPIPQKVGPLGLQKWAKIDVIGATQRHNHLVPWLPKNNYTKNWHQW